MNQRCGISIQKSEQSDENSVITTVFCIYLILGMGGFQGMVKRFMDKLQLIKRLMELNPELKAKEVESAVKVILDAMCSRLAKGGRIEIRGFGSFSLNLVQASRKRYSITDPKTRMPKKYVPQFKAAKELRERVGENEEVREGEVPSEFPAISSLNGVVIKPVQYQQHGV